MKSHLHSKLNRCTDSPRPPGVDLHPARSKHALSLLIMRRNISSHEEGATRHYRSLSHGSSTMRGTPFTSSSWREKGGAHSYAAFLAKRLFVAPKPAHGDPAKVKHFTILEQHSPRFFEKEATGNLSPSRWTNSISSHAPPLFFESQEP